MDTKKCGTQPLLCRDLQSGEERSGARWFCIEEVSFVLCGKRGLLWAVEGSGGGEPSVAFSFGLRRVVQDLTQM